MSTSPRSVPFAVHYQQRFARIIHKLNGKRAHICPWCSTVTGANGQGLLHGPFCLLREPESTSHWICKECYRDWLSDATQLTSWAALRRAHIARQRIGAPPDAA